MGTLDRRRASAMLVALLLVLFAASLATGMMFRSMALADGLVEREEISAALTNAEAGVDHARVYLLALAMPQTDDVNPTNVWDEALQAEGGVPVWCLEPVTTPDGSYRVAVSDNEDGDGNPLHDTDGLLRLRSTGEAGGETWVIRCAVKLVRLDVGEPYAILTNHDLRLVGSQDTAGLGGRVHANGDLTVEGNVSVSVAASCSGNVDSSGGSMSVAGASPGTISRNATPVEIPPVDPTLFRDYADCILASNGQVRDGKTGRVVYDFRFASETDSYNGFKWSSSGGWSTASIGHTDGTYYVEGSVKVDSGGSESRPWRATIVAERDVRMTGAPILAPKLCSTYLFVAGGDLHLQGSGSLAVAQGLLLAHEQVSISGNVRVAGRVLAESAENTPGSAVDDSKNPLGSYVGGGANVAYDGKMYDLLRVPTHLPVRSWEMELSTNASVR